MDAELRAFRLVVITVLMIPMVVGPAGAYGGLEGLAALFGEDPHAVLAPAVRNHLRAICWMFFALVPLVAWTIIDTQALAQRAGAFRIVVVMAALAGVARIAGWVADGAPGTIATLFTSLEIVVLPAVLGWHVRLVRRLVPSLERAKLSR